MGVLSGTVSPGMGGGMGGLQYGMAWRRDFQREMGPCSKARISVAHRKLDCLVSVCMAQGLKLEMKTHFMSGVHDSAICGRPLRVEQGNYTSTYIRTELTNN